MAVPKIIRKPYTNSFFTKLLREHLNNIIIFLLQIKLERVLGVTVSSNAALTCDNNGLIAYPAG